MTSRIAEHDDQNSGPLPPVPPVGNPHPVNNIGMAIRVFLISTVGLALKYAWSANVHFTDWDKVKDLSNWQELLHVTFNGFVYGLIPGAVLGLIILLAAWAGPELWSWLGPIILVAAKQSMAFLRGVSRAFRGLPDTTSTPRRSRKVKDPEKKS